MVAKNVHDSQICIYTQPQNWGFVLFMPSKDTEKPVWKKCKNYFLNMLSNRASKKTNYQRMEFNATPLKGQGDEIRMAWKWYGLDRIGRN